MTTIADQPRDLWNAVLGELQLHVTRPSFETWLRRTEGVDFRDGEFTVSTPNAFVAEMLEQRMYSLISQTVERVVKAPVEVLFRVALSPDDGDSDDSSGQALSPEPAFEADIPRVQQSPLNPRYTFERFVVGSSNELAHAAAGAVADRPGEVYNPLVMYSDVGLGKTHLMHAIGHRILSKGMSLISATTEEFTNEYIKAIREGGTEGFRDRYRNTDVLLLDDIQFLIGKEQTQEGFFHTFNALHMTNRQIVITSDRPVTALTLLEDRMQSRLSGGLVVDIQPPGIETRLAILKAKAEQVGQVIADTVLEFLAERVQQNIRLLEGSLNRVIAFAQMTNSPIDLSLVNRAIADIVCTVSGRQLPPDLVLETVSAYFGVDVGALKGRRRDKHTALARHVAMFLLREEAHLRLTTIGRMLGGKDHTTVAHGCDRISAQGQVDHGLRRDLNNIRETLARS